MQTLDILLWMDGAGEWAVEVDGSRYEHLSAIAIHRFVRHALMYAETSHVACKDSVWTLRCLLSATAPDMRSTVIS
jgi:hypothetical protein